MTLNSYFDSVDQDNDGALDKAEFKEIVAIVCKENGTTMSEGEMEGIFSLLDKDGDGEISKLEFMQGFFAFNNPETGNEDELGFER